MLCASILRRANRAVAAIAEVVGHGAVGGRADVRGHVGSAAAVVAAHFHGRRRRVGIAIDVAGTAAERGAAGRGTEAGVAGRVAVGRHGGVGGAGRAAIVAAHVGAVGAGVAVDPFGAGREGGGEQDEGKGDFGQGFHGRVFVRGLFRSAVRIGGPVLVCSLGTAFIHAIANGGRFLTKKFLTTDGTDGDGEELPQRTQRAQRMGSRTETLFNR